MGAVRRRENIMADEYYEEGAQPQAAKQEPSAPPKATPSGDVLKRNMHKHLFKSSAKKSDNALLVFFHYLAWVGIWSALIAVIYYGIDLWIGIGFSWLLVLVAGAILAIVWLTRCKRCRA